MHNSEKENKKPNRSYLGDGVYAEFDGYHIVLTVENGQDPRPTIYLEDVVLDALDLFRKKVGM
jgi:hypothetical protein